MKCPTCRRAVGDDDQCQRCGSDLTMLHDLQQRITALLAEGYAAIKKKDLSHSRYCFEQTLAIQDHCLDAQKGLALVSMLDHDFSSAGVYYQRMLQQELSLLPC